MCFLISLLTTIAFGCIGLGESFAIAAPVELVASTQLVQPLVEISIDGHSEPIKHNSAHRPVQLVSVAKVSRPTLISIAEYSAIEPISRFGTLLLGRVELAGMSPGASLQSLYCIWLN